MLPAANLLWILTGFESRWQLCTSMRRQYLTNVACAVSMDIAAFPGIAVSFYDCQVSYVELEAITVHTHIAAISSPSSTSEEMIVLCGQRRNPCIDSIASRARLRPRLLMIRVQTPALHRV